MKRKKLSKDDQSYWLKQHIRTRVFAAMASRMRIRHIQNGFKQGSQEHDALECAFHAAWEGQHSAIRWLIEFVGVQHSKDNDAVNIGQFDDGVMVPKTDPSYGKLKAIWIALSKATSHPTQGKHSDISEPVLHHATVAIINYLNRTIYLNSGIKL